MKTRAPHLRRPLPLVVVALLGVALAAAAFHLLRGNELQRQQLEFSRIADEYLRAVETEVNDSIVVVSELAVFLSRDGCSDSEAFATYAALEGVYRPGVVALAWVEAAEGAVTGRLPVTCGAGRGRGALPSGFDMGASSGLRLHLENNLREGGARLFQVSDGGLFGMDGADLFLITQPVHVGRGDERRLGGFVFGLFRFGGLLDNVLQWFDPRGVDLRLYGGEGKRPLHFPPASEAATKAAGKGLMRSVRLDVGGHAFRLEMSVDPDGLADAHTLLPSFVAGAFLLLAAALAGYLRVLQHRTEAMRRLAESRERFERLASEREQILQSLGEGVYGVDREGRATFINRAAESILGWRAEELIGRPLHEVLHHSRADGRCRPVEECPIHAASHGGSADHLQRDVFWRKDGTAVSVEYSSSPLLDAGGGVLGAVVVFADIGEQLKAEALLAGEHQLQERMMDTSPSGILITDGMGRFTFSNRRALELLQLTREEIVRRDFFSPEWGVEGPNGEPFPREALPFSLIVQRREPVFDVQFTILRNDGARRLLSVNGSPLFNADGRLERVVYTFGDITERKGAELERIRILEENRRITRQLFRVQEEERRNIARDLHDELGQYLVAMKTEMKLIARRIGEEGPETMAPLLEIADQTHEVVRGMIHRMRPVLLEKLGLGGAVDGLVNGWRGRHPEVELSLELEGELDTMESEVAHAAYRLVQEGLTNIEKYAAADHVEVSLRRESAEEGGERLRLTVADNGRGLGEGRASGMGQLGMRERVVSLDGLFRIDSAPGKGVRLSAEIPLVAAAPLPESGEKANIEP